MTGITRHKINISHKFRSITKEESLKDLKNLSEIHPTKNDLNRLAGNKFIDYYMFPYRLDVTTSYRGINFYEFIKSPSKYLGPKKYIYYTEFIKTYSAYRFYSLYISSVSIFKPLLSKYIYELYTPTCVLDPTMGWGGRMVGAIVLPDINYIGFDTNTDLIEPYKKMVADLNVSNRVNLFFQDSSKVDFSKFKYDMVFTSPPYYTKNKLVETYEHMPVYKNKEEWYEAFYYPVFHNAYKHMKPGHFCINTNVEGYDLLKRFLGPCNTKIDIKNKNATRKKNKSNGSEYIYVWIKQLSF